MRDLTAVDPWTNALEPPRDDARLGAARGILATKAAMRETLPAGLVHDPAVEILMALYIGSAPDCPLRDDAACAASGVTASVSRRWLLELEQQGLIAVMQGADGRTVALSDRGFVQVGATIDAVIARQAALSG